MDANTRAIEIFEEMQADRAFCDQPELETLYVAVATTDGDNWTRVEYFGHEVGRAPRNYDSQTIPTLRDALCFAMDLDPEIIRGDVIRVSNAIKSLGIVARPQVTIFRHTE